MDMVAGRISPSGGQQGHGHPLESIFQSDTLMRFPSQSVQNQITASTTVSGLKTAINAWIAEQPAVNP